MHCSTFLSAVLNPTCNRRLSACDEGSPRWESTVRRARQPHLFSCAPFAHRCGVRTTPRKASPCLANQNLPLANPDLPTAAFSETYLEYRSPHRLQPRDNADLPLARSDIPDSLQLVPSISKKISSVCVVWVDGMVSACAIPHPGFSKSFQV
jgi:hypothetical protein